MYFIIFLERFTARFKAFIKPFEAPQRSAKKNFNLIFSLCPGLGLEGLQKINLFDTILASHWLELCLGSLEIAQI